MLRSAKHTNHSARSLEGRRLLLAVWGSVFGILFTGFYVYYCLNSGIVDLFGKSFGRDFIAFYVASELLSNAGAAALYDPAHYAAALSAFFGEPIGLFWRYPPHYLAFIEPLASMNYFVAFALWSCVNVGLWVTALRICLRFPIQWIFYGLSAPIAIFTFFCGQNGLFIAALMIAGFVMRKTHPILAGICLGLLTIKPHLGILIPLLLIAERRWNVIVWTCVSIAMLVLGNIHLYGMHPWITFLTHAAASSPTNICVFQTPVMSISILASLCHMGLSPTVALLIQLLLASAICISFYFAMRRTLSESLRFILLCTAMLLATPYGFSYDMVALLSAILWYWREREWISRPSLIFSLLLLLMPIMLAIGERFALQSYIPLAPLILAGFYLLLWSESRHEHDAARA